MGNEDTTEEQPYSFYCARCSWKTTGKRRPAACEVCGGRMLATPYHD